MRAGRRAACLFALSGLAVLLLGGAQAAAEPALPAGFQDSVAIGNLAEPTTFRFASDGRVFVAEKSGEILVYENLQDTTPEVFADLRTDVYNHSDRGLLGLELDPEFPTKPYVYALYAYDHVLGDPSPPPKYGNPGEDGDACPADELHGADDCLISGRLVRLTAENGGNHAEESGGEVVQDLLAEGWCQQFSSHSIGDLRFGPEGALYVSGGDGGSFTNADYGQEGTPANPCGDPPKPAGTAEEPKTSEGGSLRSQNLHNLSGKMLRINPETGLAMPDNPLFSSPDPTTRKIVAYGFRNPFRFTIDPVTGEIYVDNVGSSVFEEIDRFQGPPTSAFNSGWPCYEGPERQYLFKTFENETCERLYKETEEGKEPTAQPFFYYNHAQPVSSEDECPTVFGSAISGLSFYEGSSFPAAYKGALFFGDAVRGCIWVMFPGADGRPDPTTTTRFMRESRIYPGVEIQEGPGGDLYYADLFGDEEAGPGAIHRISYNPGVPTARLTATPPYGKTLPLHVTFDAGQSSDPTGEALTYKWDLNGDGVFETAGGATRELTFTESENQVVAVQVTDGQDNKSVARVTVYPGDEPPEVTIDAPSPTYKWPVGDEIYFGGTAKNFNGELLATAGYNWTIRIAHCPDLNEPTKCHKHPLQTFSGVEEGLVTAPEHDYPSYLEMILRATDERGLSASKTLNVYPRTRELHVESAPPGVPLTAGLFSEPTPFSFTVIQGSHQVLAAPQTAQLGGATYDWTGWSDGGAQVHTVTVGESDATYTATYKARSIEGGGGGGGGGGSDGGGSSGGGGSGGGPVSLTVRLKSHPPKRTKSHTARFTFSAADDSATYRCKLDRGRFRVCGATEVYKRLKPGKHSLTVIAADGEVESTPVKFSWTVLS